MGDAADDVFDAGMRAYEGRGYEIIPTKQAAKEMCEGCRLSWRYVSGTSWRHREPMPITCQAQPIRIALGRNLAQSN